MQIVYVKEQPTEIPGCEISLQTVLLGARPIYALDIATSIEAQNLAYVTATTPLALAQARRICSGFALRRAAMDFKGASTGPPGWCVRGLLQIE